MAITGPIYWNGTTFPSQSGDPVAITQTEFEDCCCEEDPCTDCAGEQPDATVTLDVDCPGACEAAGVYTWTFYRSYGAEDCYWEWEKGGWTLQVSNTSGTWGAFIQGPSSFFSTLFSPLPCVSGALTATRSVPGSGSDDCGDCTATITFG